MNVGYVEKYRTGEGVRYRVRWSLPDGVRRSKSFKLRRDADAWLRKVEADQLRGVVNDPRRGRETLGEYALRWVAQRTRLAPRTVELYESMLRRHLLPRFGTTALGAITVEEVRGWRADVARAVSETTGAKCYRLLHAILATAEADGLIPRNPCRVEGAAVERSPERPLLTVEQVAELSDAIEPRYRALVLLAAFGGLRRGELLALTRRHVNELHNTIRVEGQAQRIKGRGRVVREPKSEAGVRTVAVSAAIMAEITSHAAHYCQDAPEAWLFAEPSGAPVREADLYEAWKEATAACGLSGVRFHDLRHFAGTAAARVGYTGRELQARLGHSTARAAMIYQHAAEERDHVLAEKVGADFIAIQATRSAAVSAIRAV